MRKTPQQNSDDPLQNIEYYKRIFHPYRLLGTFLYGSLLSVIIFIFYFTAFFLGQIPHIKILLGGIILSFLISYFLSRQDLRLYLQRKHHCTKKSSLNNNVKIVEQKERRTKDTDHPLERIRKYKKENAVLTNY